MDQTYVALGLSSSILCKRDMVQGGERKQCPKKLKQTNKIAELRLGGYEEQTQTTEAKKQKTMQWRKGISSA